MASRLPPLFLVTDRSQARGSLLEIVKKACLGGCRFLSLREKDLAPEARRDLLLEILPITRSFGATLLVHNDLEAAKLCDGIHLPADGDIKAARLSLSSNAVVGISCHSLADVKNAAKADYVTLGPIAATASKPGYLVRVLEEELSQAAALGVPVYALGGVDEGTTPRLKKIGLAGIAVMGGVMRSEDPEATVQALLRAWEE